MGGGRGLLYENTALLEAACFPVVTTRECMRFMSSSQNFKFKLGFDWVPIYSFRGLLVKISPKFDCPC